MTNLKKQIVSAMTAGALLLNVATPALAGTSLEISGNGSDSESDVVVTTSNNTAVVQDNKANVKNEISSNSNTGGNVADDNTGGDVEIETGDSDTEVNVSNSLNSNAAQVDCCQAGDTEIKISGNGTKSDNKVDLDQSNKTEVFQNNKADVYNKVDVDSNTGDNDADDNTGGNVKIKTGDASTTVNVGTTANANSAVVGGNGDEEGSISAWITGNGSDSDNDIYLDVNNDTALVQDNEANVENKVYVDSITGKNDANDNTGGDVMIETGDADADVTIDNMVNFNAADVDCGCVLDLTAKIAGNGTDSDNKIDADLTADKSVHQDNAADLENKGDVDANTGDNDADDNTGPVGSDPAITTGDADTTVDVENSGNANAYGSDVDFEWPSFDFDFSFDFDLSDLLDALGM